MKTSLPLILFLCARIVCAQVDQSELSQSLPPVSFSSYEGTHARVDTIAQIRAIGYDLGRAVNRGAMQAGTRNRYFVIHSLGNPEESAHDADIFGLGAGVGVDHIRNLRLILQGYLEGAYEYSEADARLLAEYITVYNAVYRGNWSYFQTIYKDAVIENLDSTRAGLPTVWSEWPGQTLIVIPLGTGIPGSLSAVDTETIADDKVIDEFRKDDGQGIDQRKDMVDLKEREATEAEDQAIAQRNEATNEANRIAEERERINQERENNNRQQDQNTQENAEENPAGAAQNPETTGNREAELNQREQELREQEKLIEQKQNEADETAARAGQKIAEAQQERDNIARDQGLVTNTPQAVVVGILGVVLTDPASPTGALVTVNPATGAELKRSTLNTVNVRTLTLVNGRIFAAADRNETTRLVEIDPDNLSVLTLGEDAISPDSPLWRNAGDFYAVTMDRNSYYISRFDTDLVRQAQSAVPWIK
ncbi:hypothetical protein FACS1894164_12920 [Spirochaetia bacterium]|nr:hypothetical protein FACS1894164_12920 [Spirochaetia bacterium]